MFPPLLRQEQNLKHEPLLNGVYWEAHVQQSEENLQPSVSLFAMWIPETELEWLGLRQAPSSTVPYHQPSWSC